MLGGSDVVALIRIAKALERIADALDLDRAPLFGSATEADDE